jgi:hypothetical protein
MQGTGFEPRPPQKKKPMMYVEMLRRWFYVVYFMNPLRLFYDYENELCMILSYW